MKYDFGFIQYLWKNLDNIKSQYEAEKHRDEMIKSVKEKLDLALQLAKTKGKSLVDEDVATWSGGYKLAGTIHRDKLEVVAKQGERTIKHKETENG